MKTCSVSPSSVEEVGMMGMDSVEAKDIVYIFLASTLATYFHQLTIDGLVLVQRY